MKSIFPPKNKQIPVPILPLQDPQLTYINEISFWCKHYNRSVFYASVTIDPVCVIPPQLRFSW
jgi:hypothetical protein